VARALRSTRAPRHIKPPHSLLSQEVSNFFLQPSHTKHKLAVPFSKNDLGEFPATRKNYAPSKKV